GLLSALNSISLESKEDLSGAIHAQMIAALRIFFCVGGMPEAVFRYAATRKFTDANEVHESVVETYKSDFIKYGEKKDILKLHHVFDFAARNVGKKVKYVN